MGHFKTLNYSCGMARDPHLLLYIHTKFQTQVWTLRQSGSKSDWTERKTARWPTYSKKDITVPNLSSVFYNFPFSFFLHLAFLLSFLILNLSAEISWNNQGKKRNIKEYLPNSNSWCPCFFFLFIFSLGYLFFVLWSCISFFFLVLLLSFIFFLLFFLSVIFLAFLLFFTIHIASSCFPSAFLLLFFLMSCCCFMFFFDAVPSSFPLPLFL